MNTVNLFSIVIVVLFLSCSKSISETPACLNDKIVDYGKSATCKDAAVKEYKFQSKTVYVFEPGTCGADMTSAVISMDCKTLGHLGGITGNTKINGEEFSNAVFVKIVWKK